jgi:predicted permease
MDELRLDLRYALRTLLRRPGFAISAIAILALAVGINAAMFSVVRGVLLAPLPYASSENLVRVHHVHQEGGVSDGAFSPPDYDDIRDAATSFSDLAAFWYAPGLSNATLTKADDAVLLSSAYVSPEFFATLGVAPLRGRTPRGDEMVEGSDRVIVLSHAFWQTQFGGDPAIIGSVVNVQNGPYQVVGVMPPTFAYPAGEVDAWFPLSLITDEMIPRRRGIRYLGVVGRLAPGVDANAAESELSGIAVRLAADHPASNEGWHRVRAQGIREELLGEVRSPLLVLTAAVALVLLIGCANLVNLLLSRAAGREGEFAVRAALGAQRRRLVRQLVTESTVLALVGGAAGILLAHWLIDVFVALAAGDLPRTQNVRLDFAVVGFAVGLAVIAGIVTGLIPALRAMASASGALREGGRGMTAGARRQRLRGSLIAAEMALAVMLVVSAGVLLRGLVSLMRVDPGFTADNVLTVSLNVPPQRYETGVLESIQYRNLLMERMLGLPGVERVAVAKTLPLEGGGEPYAFAIPGRVGSDQFEPQGGVMIVSPDYFATLGVPLVRGRAFDGREMRSPAGDGASMQLSLIINEAAARRYFPGEDAVGQRLMLGETPIEVIGVAGDVRHEGLQTAPVPTAYVSIDLMPRLSLRIMLRTSRDPATLIAPVRAAIRQLEPGQPIAEIVPLSVTVYRAMARERFLASLLGTFAALALLLAALGIYGVVSYSVTQRLHEVGIRMALGADVGRVVRMIVAQSAAWWGAGIVIGIAGALLGVRLLQELVYGISVLDPRTFLLATLLLAFAALVASLIPAWRAGRVDPSRAFRAG